MRTYKMTLAEKLEIKYNHSNLYRCRMGSPIDEDPKHTAPRIYLELIAIEVGLSETMAGDVFDLPDGGLLVVFFDGFSDSFPLTSPSPDDKLTAVELSKDELPKYGAYF